MRLSTLALPFLLTLSLGPSVVRADAITTIFYTQSPERFIWDFTWDMTFPQASQIFKPTNPVPKEWMPQIKLLVFGSPTRRFEISGVHSSRLHDGTGGHPVDVTLGGLHEEFATIITFDGDSVLNTVFPFTSPDNPFKDPVPDLGGIVPHVTSGPEHSDKFDLKYMRIFGPPVITFQYTGEHRGEPVPAPSSVCLLLAAAFCSSRRRRRR